MTDESRRLNTLNAASHKLTRKIWQHQQEIEGLKSLRRAINKRIKRIIRESVKTTQGDR